MTNDDVCLNLIGLHLLQIVIIHTVEITQRNTTCSKDNTLNVPNNPLGALIPSFVTTGCNYKVLYLFGPV